MRTITRLDHVTRRSIASVALLVGLAVDEEGLSVEDVLAGTGISVDALSDPDAEITAEGELVVIGRLVALGASPSFAVRAGMRYRLGAFGMFGYALMNCATARDAVAVFADFSTLSYALSTISLVEQGDEVIALFSFDHPDPDVRAFVIERDMVTVAMVSRDLAGVRLPVRRWCLSHARRASPETYAAVVRGDVLFGQPQDCMVMAATQMDTPLPLANPLTRAQSLRACEELVERRRQLVGIVGDVRSFLMRHADTMPGMEEAAEFLHLTPRTLRRRLLAEGTTYRDVVSDLRDDLAVSMLRDGRLALADIAFRLGYQDTTSFLTAFKRRHGVTPSAFRAGARMNNKNGRESGRE